MLAELGRILRFALVGLSSTAVYLVLLWLLKGWIASVVLLTTLCYLLSTAYNYILQSVFTFRAGRLAMYSARRYALAHLLAMGLNSGLMAWLVTGLQIPLFVAQIMVTALVSVLVFILSRNWVFSAVNASPDYSDIGESPNASGIAPLSSRYG